MDGGPEGVWISAGRTKRANSIVAKGARRLRDEIFPTDGGLVYRSAVVPSLLAAPRLTSPPLCHGGSGVGISGPTATRCGGPLAGGNPDIALRGRMADFDPVADVGRIEIPQCSALPRSLNVLSYD
jgi:hypothetical protein